MPRDREADADRDRAGEQWADYRHDLEYAGEDAEQEPVGLADQPEDEREDRRDEGNQEVSPRTNAPSLASIRSRCRVPSSASAEGLAT